MEAPTPLKFNDYINTSNKSINSLDNSIKRDIENQSKEYILKINNSEYTLKIIYDTNKIFFKIEKKNEFLLFNYESKYNYKDIISILKLPSDLYNESNKVVEVLDKAYENQKLILKFDEDNTCLLLIVKLSVGFQEIDCPLKIRKKYYDINEKFDIILEKLKSLKQNKKEFINSQILELEQKIESLKKHIVDELNNIKEIFQSFLLKNKENTEKLHRNQYEIKILKEELISLKEIYKNKKKENIESNNVDDNKKKNKGNNNIITRGLSITSPSSSSSHTPIQETVYEIKKLNKEEKEDFTFNIIIEGAEKVGKSSIIEKFVEVKENTEKEGNFKFGYKITKQYINIDNIIIKLEITDFLIGDISRRSANNYKNADLIMFIYSINDAKSFEKITQKLRALKSKSYQVYFLIGNKSELENRNVSQKEAKNIMAKYNINYFIEVSAKYGKNIDNIFYEAVKILYKSKKTSDNNKNKIINLSKDNIIKKSNTTLYFLLPRK